MPKVLITTAPFGDRNRLPIDKLEEAGIEYFTNPVGRKLTENELLGLISDFDVLIAGTELITEKVMDEAKSLRLISRVGIGLDGVDLLAARRRGIQVSYTPDAPAAAVAELTIGLMLSTMRSVHVASAQMHRGEWQRHFGRRLSEVTIGIIGVGRIGRRVMHHLAGFEVPRILANDLEVKSGLPAGVSVDWVSKNDIFREADLISLHLPLNGGTKNMIRRDTLSQTKKDAIIINTSRGGIIDEKDLADALRSGHLSAVAIDVFSHEPYTGELAEIEKCLLTAHMGSMSVDCRARMEIEATEEVVRFVAGQPLRSLVPQQEYDIRLQGL